MTNVGNSLIEITQKTHNVLLDLRYSTTDNFANEKLYSSPKCFLHKSALEKFENAIDVASRHNCRIKIFDAYRPIDVQRRLFDKFPHGGFVSNPVTGSVPHTRGVAVDITLVDGNGLELNMGTDFDNFTDKASHNYIFDNKEINNNRFLLLGIMTLAGWDFYSEEWWHYQLFNATQYSVINDFNF